MQDTPTVTGSKELAMFCARRSGAFGSRSLVVCKADRHYGLRILSGYQTLESLTIKDSPDLKPDHLKVLMELDKLRQLTIVGCPALSAIVGDEEWGAFFDKCTVSFSDWPGASSPDQVVSYQEVKEVGRVGELIADGNTQAALEALSDIKNISLLDKEGFSLLHYAVQSGQMSLVKALIQRGAQVNLISKKGLSCLHLALSRADLPMVEFLLQNDADPNQNFEESTCLLLVLTAQRAQGGAKRLGGPVEFLAARLPLLTALIKAGARVDEQVALPANKLPQLSLRPGLSGVDAGHNCYTALALAAIMGDQKAVACLLDNGAAPNGPEGFKGMPPIFCSVLKGHADVFSLLVERGADKNVKWFQNTAIHMALLWEKREMVAFLIEQGLDLAEKGIEAVQPLHVCAMRGDLESAKALIQAGAPLDGEADEGFTPLHVAAQRGRIAMVELLLDAGAPIDYSGGDDKPTPLVVAVLAKHVPVIEVLLARGAAFGREELLNELIGMEISVEIPSLGKIPLIHLTALRGYIPAIKHLVDNGQSYSAKTDAGLTLLHAAAFGGKVEMIDWLYGQKSIIDDWDKEGRSPLRCAISGGSYPAAERLLQLGANPNAADSKKMTALHAAALQGEAQLVRLLLLNGATVDQPESNGLTPLHLAAQKNACEVASELQQKGVDLEARDRNGSTPLHWATLTGNKEMAAWLLNQKVEVDSRDSKQRTPLHRAVERGRIELVSLLAERGADLNATDEDGVTPVVLAHAVEKQNILDELLRRGARPPKKGEKCVIS